MVEVTTNDHPPADALVLVDLQDDYFSDDTLDAVRAGLVRVCNGLAAAAHEAGTPVIEVRTVHDATGSTWALNMVEDGQGMAIEGTSGVAPLPELDLGQTVRVSKTRDSAFHQTVLVGVLARLGVRTIALGGVSTESCVMSTATDAYAHDVRVLLVEDAIGCVDDAWHDASLAQLHRRFRQPVLGAEQVRFRRPAR